MQEDEEKKKKKKSRPSLPPQEGRLIFEGRKATQFWVRALGLEAEMEVVREMIAAKPERARGAVPIVAEYEVDERLKFFYIIQADVDTLGIQDGIGIIYWASPERAKEVLDIRNKRAKDLLRQMYDYPGFDEVIPIEAKREK